MLITADTTEPKTAIAGDKLACSSKTEMNKL